MLNPFPQRIDLPSPGDMPAEEDDHARPNGASAVAANRTPEPQSMNDVPLYNSRIIDNYIKLIKFKYPWIDAAG